MISRAAKGSKDSQVSQGWIGTFFFGKQAGGHFARRPFLRPPSMSDGAGNCTVMIVHPVRCQGRQKTGVSKTFLTHHTAPYQEGRRVCSERRVSLRTSRGYIYV